MGIIHTLLLSIVEGITEFIPVSSTAHILLTANILRLSNTPFLEVFSIAIQSGAILAAVWFFWNTIWSTRTLIPKVIVGFIPTAIAGVVLYPLIKPLFDHTAVIAWALIAGGICLLFIRPIDIETTPEAITYKQAFLIGLMQIASFIPGVSRAGATLIGGTLLRIPRQTIVTFSFLLAIPTILGASVVELRHAPALTHTEWFLMGFGIIISFIVALLSIRFFINLLTKKPLSYFGWYRIVVGVLVLILL